MARLVAPRKITGYLLATTTPEAAAKARFFIAAGFTRERPQELAEALRAHPETAALERVFPDAGYGEKLVYRCAMPPAPDGRAYCVRSVWMRRGADLHFVTAYPQP